MPRTLKLLLLTIAILASFSCADDTPSPTDTDAITTTAPCVRYHKTGFWDIDILTWELDPKICGPPLSYNANTDKSKLPLEICAVLGAYLFLVVGLGTLLLTVGRKARRVAQGYVPLFEVEMMDAHKKSKNFEPLSPASTSKTWFKRSVGSMRGSIGGGANPRHSDVDSVSSFDARVLQGDRMSRMSEMERLYAAAYAHEEAKKSVTSLVTISPVAPVDPPTFTKSPRVKPVMRVNTSGISANLPRIVTDTDPVSRVDSMQLPLSPRNPVRAIHPPAYQHSGLHVPAMLSPALASPMSIMSLTSPTFNRVELPDDMYPAPPPPINKPAMSLPPAPSTQPPSYGMPLSPRSAFRPPSLGAASHGGSSIKSRKAPGLKNLYISPPTRHDDDDRAPLTPRVDQNGQQIAQTPGTAFTYMSEDTVASNETDYRYESLDQPAPLPLSPRPLPKTVTLQLPPNASPNPGSHKSASSSSNTLPFRAFSDTSLTSPAPTKTTFLERRTDKVGRGPLTARTPMTGVPYSPYMPFTPITPVTPHLVSRQERKERIRAQAKKVTIEEEAVQGEEEMWE